MKIKWTLPCCSVLFVSLLFFASCSKKEVNCSDEDGRKVFYDLLSLDFEKNYINPYPANSDFAFNLPYEDVVKEFFKESVKMSAIRPTEINKELKKCSCEALLEVEFPEQLITFLADNNKYDFNFDEIDKKVAFDDVDYSYQLTEDDRIFCESSFGGGLRERFNFYAILKNYQNNVKNGASGVKEKGERYSGILKFVDFQFGDNPHYLFEDEKGNLVDFLAIEDDAYDLLLNDDTINPKYRNRKFKIKYRTEKLYPYDDAEELVDHYIITGIEMVK